MSPLQYIEKHPLIRPEVKHFVLAHPTMTQVWDICPRVDWLLYICELDALLTQREAVQVAIFCARQRQDTHGRHGHKAVTCTEHWLEGKATAYECHAAYREAMSTSVFAASANPTVPCPAAYSLFAAAYAARAAASTTAQEAVFCAWRSATYAVFSETPSPDRQAQADYLRSIKKNPF